VSATLALGDVQHPVQLRRCGEAERRLAAARAAARAVVRAPRRVPLHRAGVPVVHRVVGRCTMTPPDP
jgi:hypothetical protein